jgi:hypothetical protein
VVVGAAADHAAAEARPVEGRVHAAGPVPRLQTLKYIFFIWRSEGTYNNDLGHCRTT